MKKKIILLLPTQATHPRGEKNGCTQAARADGCNRLYYNWLQRFQPIGAHVVGRAVSAVAQAQRETYVSD